jgi:hypothetical protein
MLNEDMNEGTIVLEHSIQNPIYIPYYLHHGIGIQFIGQSLNFSLYGFIFPQFCGFKSLMDFSEILEIYLFSLKISK